MLTERPPQPSGCIIARYRCANLFIPAADSLFPLAKHGIRPIDGLERASKHDLLVSVTPATVVATCHFGHLVSGWLEDVDRFRGAQNPGSTALSKMTLIEGGARNQPCLEGSLVGRSLQITSTRNATGLCVKWISPRIELLGQRV